MTGHLVEVAMGQLHSHLLLRRLHQPLPLRTQVLDSEYSSSLSNLNLPVVTRLRLVV